MVNTSPRDIVISLVVFAVIMVSVFFMVASGINNYGINESSSLNAAFQDFNSSLSLKTDDIVGQANDAGGQLASGESSEASMFVKALRIINTIWTSPSIMFKMFQYLKTATFFKDIPGFAWAYLITIIMIFIIMVIAEVIWRYKV